MMNLKNLIVLCICLLPTYCWAQNNIFPTNGNVGIGTTSPLREYKLDVRGGLSSVGSESRFSVGTFIDPASGITYGLKVGGGDGCNRELLLEGTANPSYTEISSNTRKKFKVKMDISVPDYVFERCDHLLKSKTM